MEILIKKESLRLFYSEQFINRIQSINKIIDTNDQLKRDLNEYNKIKDSLLALNEEIAGDPNIETLQEILSLSISKKTESNSFFESIISQVLRNIMNIYK